MSVPVSSPALEVARDWPCPPRTIVAAVDFAEASSRAVALAGVIAARSDAGLRVLHAERSDAPPYFTPAQIERLEGERADAAAGLHGELTRFARDATSWPAQVMVAEGAPVEIILQAAADADLLVLGTHGRRGPARWWLGSVAERVVRGADVPVLVTRAAVTDAVGVFARVVLVGDGELPDQPARDCLARLVAVMGGSVVATAVLDHCAPDELTGATLVAVAARPGRSSWGISDVVAEALGRCAHPALFLPARSQGDRT